MAAAQWGERETFTFLTLLQEHAQDLHGTCHSDDVYMEMVGKIQVETGKHYRIDQLRSKYYRMQKDYKLFTKLLNTETGRDRFAQQPSCDKERWAAFLKINPEYKIFKKKGLQNYDMYGPLFENSNATGSMAFSSGGTQPSGNADSNARTFSGPLSGEKRPMSCDERPSKDKRMKGKVQMWPDEILEMARNVSESALASKAAKESKMSGKEDTSDANDSLGMDEVQDIIEALDVDTEIKIKAFTYLFDCPRMWRPFCRMTPEFRRSWILSIQTD